MTPAVDDPVARWQRVAALFDAAQERGQSERARYLEKACRGDPALRTEVEALLARTLVPSFLDSDALALAAPLFAPDVTARQPDWTEQDTSCVYRLERMLARGGMATVYLARDSKHDRWVAVKVLDSELSERVGAGRFVQEIRLTARLQHPHVLGLLDSGVFVSGALAGRPYYVMPYVAGESLRARLARGPLDVKEATHVLREIADALSYAHEQGVIHRDIKPENILLSRGHAVVADFGIAKALAESQSGALNEARGSAVGHQENATHFSTLVGTPAYMAPEQAVEGALVDHRADLYAWGVMAYELFACAHPFERKATALSLITAHRREMPIPLRQIAPRVPERLAAIVMQCLATPPDERPRTASEILSALDGWAADRKWPLSQSSHRHFRTAVVAGMLALGGALGASVVHGRTQPILVMGTGDASHDVRALQDALDRGGAIKLQGRFSLAAAPTKPVAALLASAWYPAAAELLISKAVDISGVRDARGQMATIEAGMIPLYVDAPGKHVSIRGLRFLQPRHTGILVAAVRGLEISSSRFEGIVPSADGSGAISINTRGEMPLPSSAGKPENISGDLLIAHNEIDATGGTRQAPTAGVTVFSVGGFPGERVRLDIISNHISNTTAPAINIRHVDGSVRVVGNTVQTSAETVGDVDAVRLVNAGSILMANNTVECKWSNAAAIQVFSPFSDWPTERVTVEDNTVLMSPPPNVTLGDYSAGISIRGFARGIIVRRNHLGGHAYAALSMYAFRGGVPRDNVFIDNRLDGFRSTVADIFVGSGVTRTHIAGSGSLSDHGTATTRER